MAHKTTIKYLNKENILIYLSSFAEEMRRIHGNIVFDMLIVGGSALALKDSYRGSTVDIDGSVNFGGNISEAIKRVYMKYGIYEDWLNQDFMYSTSYSKRLWENAIYYTTLNRMINVYVVNDLDQLCMKVISFRRKDFEDIRYLVGLLKHQGYTYKNFEERLMYLYGPQCRVTSQALRFVKRLFR